jgi:hypothetical protein
MSQSVRTGYASTRGHAAAEHPAHERELCHALSMPPLCLRIKIVTSGAVVQTGALERHRPVGKFADERIGQHRSMCDSDYSPALTQLAQKIVARLK